MKEEDAIHALSGLAHSLRLRLFRALVVAGPAGLTPSVLIEQMGGSASTLSFHLKELMHSGLVTQERQGRNLIYRASFTTMNELLGYLTENCCEGAACSTTDAVADCRC